MGFLDTVRRAFGSQSRLSPEKSGQVRIAPQAPGDCDSSDDRSWAFFLERFRRHEYPIDYDPA